MNEPTIWVVYNDTRKDFSKAGKFGKLKDIFSSAVRNYDGALLIEHVQTVLEKSNPEDYLLIVGDPALCSIATVVMADLHGTVNMLRWNRDTYQYNPLTLTFYE